MHENDPTPSSSPDNSNPLPKEFAMPEKDPKPISSPVENSDYTPPREFCPSTELEADKLPEGVNYGYTVFENNVRTYGYDLAFLIAMIESLSTRYGYCFMNNATFACRLGRSQKTVERWIKILEDHHVIYRNTWNTPKGRVRHIVPQSKYLTYWEKFLCRKKIHEDVRKSYIEFIFKGEVPEHFPKPPDPNKPKEKKKKVPLDKTNDEQPHQSGDSAPGKKSYATLTDEGVHATLTDGGSLLLRNNSSKHKERTTEGASPQAAVVVSFEDMIEKELKSIGITGERVKFAKEYYKLNQKAVDAKNNPMGWIVKGVKEGWITDMVHKQKVKPQAPKHENRPPPPPVKPKEPRRLDTSEVAIAVDFLRRYKALVDPSAIMIDIHEDHFMWEAANQKGSRWKQPFVEGCLKILDSLARNMGQEKALEFIEREKEEKKNESLCA